MADISKITALDGTTYDIKDETARTELDEKLTAPTTTGTTGQYLQLTDDGTAWADVSGGGSVDTVNNISPDSDKNVQTVVELTQDEYDALASPDANVVYFITDSTSEYATASNIEYDNTDSGLTATTVQDAIDEVDANVDSLSEDVSTNTANISTNTANISTNSSNISSLSSSKANLIATTTASTTITVATSGSTQFTLTSTLSGYTPIMYALGNANSSYIVRSVESVTFSSGTATISGYAHTTWSASQSVYFFARFLWIKN